jgi:hypothetical protein
LGQVVGEALQQRSPAAGGWPAVALLRQGKFLQAIDVQFGQQRLVALPA